jgi:hypothetical protein
MPAATVTVPGTSGAPGTRILEPAPPHSGVNFVTVAVTVRVRARLQCRLESATGHWHAAAGPAREPASHAMQVGLQVHSELGSVC